MAMLHVHHLLTLTLTLTLAQTLPLPTEPTPTTWPDRFHMLLVMNDTATANVSVGEFWYDFSRGLNVILIQKQYMDLIHNVFWNNGTQFYYNNRGFCDRIQYEVGIPRPDWMQGAVYEGQVYVDGFLCNVWNKVDFTWYYEEVNTKRPIQWYFYNGFAVHVITFEVGGVAEHSKWQAPTYCFDDKQVEKRINAWPFPSRPVPGNFGALGDIDTNL